MKQIWTSRVAQAAGKYGDNAPMAAVCCNACRTCVTTNGLSLALAAIIGAGRHRPLRAQTRQTLLTRRSGAERYRLDSAEAKNWREVEHALGRA